MVSLSLDINKARSLDEALREYFKPEFLKNANRYRCEKCKTKVDAKKQYRIDQRPNTVILQLKRFDYRAHKISSRVTFPEYLSLDEYDVNPCQGQKYELSGIVVHLGGSLYSGHYVSYVKSAGRWYSCNDSMVSSCDFDRVKNNEAYMLVYSLKKAALPPPAKQAPGTLVHSSHHNTEKPSKEVGMMMSSHPKHQVNGISSHGKMNNLTHATRLEVREGESKAPAPTPATVKLPPSNGMAQIVQQKKEAPQPQIQNFSFEVPLRKTVSSPVGPAEHPLFGRLFTNDTVQNTELKSGPAWYLNPDQPSQLQKRRPEEVSSRNSSTKKMVKLHHSGLQRIKEMNKKIKLLDFSSLRVSRAVSAEFPERASHRQELMTGPTQAY
jgi:hypothetical protein